VQLFACWTDVHITLGVIGEHLDTKKLGSVIHIGNGNVGMDALVFDGNQIFSEPYFLSPVTCRGQSFQRKRVRQSKSSIGWLSITSEGVTNAATMMRA
jgi:hypothetical protein